MAESESNPEPSTAAPVVANGKPASKATLSLGVIGQTKRWLRIVFAFMLITIAAILGLVPLIPGWPLGIFGLSILAAEFAWARRLMKRLRKEGVRLRDAITWRRPKKPRAARRSSKA
jgi:hypothetical protein